ncbi:hypothetical protein F5882DRAFT_412619 [Hyaloscypha sp. PMI_1271]|nr:hypothetical protein F5882DRAFT_412619 [Hyaloscypha sp. PMI_1271]
MAIRRNDWCVPSGHTADGYPFCGPVPGKVNPFVLTVCNGGAMPLIFWTAEGIAKMIREDVPFEQSDIPKNFKITEERLKKGWQILLCNFKTFASSRFGKGRLAYVNPCYSCFRIRN